MKRTQNIPFATHVAGGKVLCNIQACCLRACLMLIHSTFKQIVGAYVAAIHANFFRQKDFKNYLLLVDYPYHKKLVENM